MIIKCHLCVFSVDSGAELARSLPTTVPESPSAHQPRTPRTPRTPGRQDPNKTPRFYPVMKESGTVDGQVETVLYIRLTTENYHEVDVVLQVVVVLDSF